jgi:hypothetical protein
MIRCGGVSGVASGGLAGGTHPNSVVRKKSNVNRFMFGIVAKTAFCGTVRYEKRHLQLVLFSFIMPCKKNKAVFKEN